MFDVDTVLSIIFSVFRLDNASLRPRFLPPLFQMIIHMGDFIEHSPNSHYQ